MNKISLVSCKFLPVAVTLLAFADTPSLFAFKDASGLIANPLMMNEFFENGVTHHQSLDRNAAGSATTADLEALSGLMVNYNWDGFERIEGRLGVANYLHFTGATATEDRSIRLTTTYSSLNQSNWAGVGTNGSALLVSGTHAYYMGSIGGSWSQAVITLGRLTDTGDNPVGSRNAAFMTEAGVGMAYGVRSAGFVLSNVQLGRSFTASFFDMNENLLTSLTGTSLSGSGGTDGEEIFFGFDAGENSSSWISRIVVTGDNGGQNVGLDNFGFTEITVILPAGQGEGGYAGWRGEQGFATSEEGAPMADPDGDGLINLVEYALGLNPLSPNRAGLPAGVVESIGDDNYLTLSVARNPAAVDVDFIVEVSADLINWDSGSDHTTTLENSPALLRVRDNIPLMQADRRFIRLRIDPAE